jgi:cell division protein FtsQ
MKRKIKILAHIMAWVLFVTTLTVTLAFTWAETASVKCDAIEVNFYGDETIRLSSQEITRMVKAADKDLIGKKLREINAEEIEKEVGKHNTILKADAYKMVVRDTTGYKGVLAVKVKHRTPVMRVITPDVSYYMDTEGVRFPTSTRYSANVVLVTGNVSEELARGSLLPLIRFVSGNDFWQAQIKQIHVDRNEELLMTPLVGNQLIEFGTAEDFRKKLRNLMAFYEQVLASNNWDKYERISLKYRNQIIAKKRD